MLKKLCCLCLCALLSLACLSGCGAAPAGEDTGKREPAVVVTIYPIYDWVTNLLGSEGTAPTLLLDGGTDMHSYQPTVADLALVSSCDLLIYVGGESDAWVEDALQNAVNPKLRALKLMEVLGDAARREEIVGGMQSDGEEEAENYDEHIWLSLRNAGRCCAAIAEALEALYPAEREAIAANAEAYLAALAEADAEYTGAVASAGKSTLLFADRFPFRYLTEDYGLDYYAAFPGCEAETEASFETVRFLASKLDELELSAVMTTESPAPRLAETVIENSERKIAAILVLDSMQSARIEDGRDYLARMGQNLEVLRRALN